MAITISEKMRNQVLDGIGNTGAGDDFDLGSLKMYTGAPPDVDAAPTGTELVDITLPADAFAASASQVMAKAGTWSDTSTPGAGVAAYFRIITAADDEGATGATYQRIQGSVDQGSGDIDLDNKTIAIGQTVTITTFTISMPDA